MWVEVFGYGVRDTLWLFFEKAALYFAFVDEVLQFKGLLDVAFASSGELLVVDHAVSVAIRETQEKMNLERRQVDHFASFERLFGLSDVNGCVALWILLFELLQNLVLERVHVVLHHFADGNFISDMVEHTWELCVMYEFLLLESDKQVLFLWRQEFCASNHIFEVLEVARALLDVIQFLEPLLK